MLSETEVLNSLVVLCFTRVATINFYFKVVNTFGEEYIYIYIYIYGVGGCGCMCLSNPTVQTGSDTMQIFTSWIHTLLKSISTMLNADILFQDLNLSISYDDNH